MAKKSLNRREFMKAGAVGVLGGAFSLNAFGDVDTTPLEATWSEQAIEELKTDTLVPVTVETVHCDQPNNIPVVQLKDKTGHQLHIYVGVAEGNAIRMALESQATPRPMTHDFVRNLMEASESHVEFAAITKLEQTTFHAMLVVNQGGERRAVDCRPSDAMALCLRTQSPVYANRSLLSG